MEIRGLGSDKEAHAPVKADTMTGRVKTCMCRFLGP
jgi:hypothetical protein